MMDKENLDKLTKDILAASKLEITKPDFNMIVMDKIKAEHRKQSILHDIALYSLIFIVIDGLIISLLWLFDTNIFNIPARVKVMNFGIHFNIQNGSSDFGSFLLIYFVILAIVILGLNLVSGSRYVQER